MAAMTLVFIASLPDHNVEVLLSTYAIWISSFSNRTELEKLPAASDWPERWPRLVGGV
ncbi:hypothetical protein ACCD10_06165 [Pseudomonas sp. Pseusp122]|uniref:hypothetical protein n=1 Tax=unclassified Pseudomonas TaxID=196821 RepID=UPI0039A5E946